MSNESIITRIDDHQRVRKMRTLLNVNRLFALMIFISGFALVISSIDSSIWNFQSFWFGLKFIIFIFELLFLVAGYGIALMLGYDDAGAVALMTAIHNALFGGNETLLGIPIEDLILDPLQIPAQQNIVDSIFAFFIIISMLIALISGLGFLRECNPALSAVSFFAMNIVLGLASLNDKLLISLDFNSSSIIEMVFSKLVITAFLIYFFLELSFQASYIYNVIGPNVHRHRRISSNIKRLKEFVMPTKQELKQPNKEEIENIPIKGNNTSQARLRVTATFSKIKGLVGKKLFKITDEEDWDKMNNRLKNFYNRLEENDPLIAVSLSASAYTPSITRLILIITTGTLFRMTILIILSWLALNPIPILRFLNMPESVISSVEAGQPEMIMLILAPLAMTFLLLGLIVEAIQKRVSKRMERISQGPIIHPVVEQVPNENSKVKRKKQKQTQTSEELPQ